MKNLEKAREEKGITRTQLAYRSEVSYASIVAYENGTRKASAEAATRIADVLDCTVEELMG